MNRRLLLAFFAVMLASIGVAFWTSMAFAQQIFIPNVSVQEVNLGDNPEISWQSCQDIDGDGNEEMLFALSKRKFSNGTPLSTIQSIYKLHPGDFASYNARFFPNRVISSYTGQSGVCLPVHYNAMFPPEDDPMFKEGFVVKFIGDRPGWESNLWYSVQAADTFTETFTTVFGAVALDSVWGSAAVGTVEWGGSVWGTIIKYVSGSTATAMLGRAVTGYVIADRIYEIYYNSSTYGVNYPATILSSDGKAGIVYYSKESDYAHLTCGKDAVSMAENLMIPQIERLYLTGVNNEGCIITLDAQYTGQKAFPFAIVHQYATEVVAEKTLPLTREDAIRAMEGIEEAFGHTETDPEDEDHPRIPIDIPDDPSEKCPRLNPEDRQLRQMTIFLSQGEFNYRMRDPSFASSTSAKDMLEFINDADAFTHFLVYQDRYRTEFPGDGLLPLQGQLTTFYDAPDMKGYNWAFEYECTYNSIEGEYEWFPNRWAGRLATGLTRDDGVGDFRVYINPGN